jgi:tryptophan 2,3-dioxygenase
MKKEEYQYTSIHYNDYLQLAKITDAQDLRSAEAGKPAHEEMLFIIVHQVYELWFKQINHEMRSIMDMFDDDVVDERSIGVAVNRLNRIIEIFKLLVDQIRILETMTPLDFLDFRKYLFPASGFQSFQFRELEVLMGLKETNRHTYGGTPYKVVFDEKRKEELTQMEESRSLLQLVEDWLERTPFLNFDDFNFLESYKEAVTHMVQREKEAITNTDLLSEKYKALRLKALGDTDTYFENIFDEAKHNQLLKEGKVQMSYKATVAGLFINLYRDEPILQLPFQFLQRLTDIDEYFTTWRYRHAQMVLRMLGRKVGTGGSSGHDYLNKTAQKHHIFGDLHNISTLLIPRSDLPPLPEKISLKLGYYFSASY